MPRPSGFTRPHSRVASWVRALASPSAQSTVDPLWEYLTNAQARPLLHYRGQGPGYPIMPAQWGKATALVAPGSGSGATNYGGWSNIGTPTHPTPTIAAGGLVIDLVTGATANNEGGIMGNSEWVWRSQGFFFAARILFPDASYGATTTGSRIFVGLKDGTLSATVAAADDPGGNHIGFSRSTNASETNWRITNRNGTTRSNVDSGVAFTTGGSAAMYDFLIYQPPSGVDTTCYWALNLNGGVTTGTFVTANLPSTTTLLRQGAVIRTLTTTARNMHLVKAYTEAEA